MVALRLAAQPSEGPREGWVGDVVATYLRWGVPAVALLGAGVLMYLHGLAAGIVGLLMGFFGQLVLVPVVAGGTAVASWVYHAGRGRPARSLRIFDEPAPRGDEIVGIVRVRRPVSSPLSHTPCGAYRLVGRTSVGAVDEAAAGELLVETEDGAFVVEARHAQVRLEPPTTHPVVRPDAALTKLLEERSLEPTRGPVHLAERILRDGDRVRVRGLRSSERREDGYRGHEEAARIEAFVLLEG
ncbi:MAG: hypothetical protein H6721_17505 [Sandaracinus sp.]|nr:hypothetical protein [Sandaracinus sp.]MCB9633919.1 hypothetical protein [Sandaracinus sp.]